MQYRLLEKTEIWITPLRLHEADLAACAQAAGEVLGLTPEQIMVTDAQTEHLVFDVLTPTVEARQIVARKGALLDALSRVPGVEINENTEVHSDGILGMISLGTDEGREVLERTEKLQAQLKERLARRAKVFPTGTEVINGQIKDTNTPFLVQELETMGFTVATSPPLPDQLNRIANSLRNAVEEGYGLVITTGGVGAEGKDQTVEALLALDPEAATPYVLKFTKGQGRHAKDGVRLGVGRLGQCIMVTLPGPNDEVRLTWPVLSQGLSENWPKERLAAHLADALRQKFLDHQPHHAH
ncbi:MAG: competence/damage-inducible protein A [Deltaproteobacteria bacterium]|nr:competence/damage-inducible protein A [Deltaproteobacteria bacterium]